jgi:ribose 5-phosphate isomerase RpiB
MPNIQKTNLRSPSCDLGIGISLAFEKLDFVGAALCRDGLEQEAPLAIFATAGA